MSKKMQKAKLAQLLVAEFMSDSDSMIELLLHVVRVRPSVIIDAVESIPVNNRFKTHLSKLTAEPVLTPRQILEKELMDEYIKKGHHFIACIKQWRAMTGDGLREAKEYMDSLRAKGVVFSDYPKNY